MKAHELPCPSCRRPLPLDPAWLETAVSCPACQAPLQVIPFPALGRQAAAGLAAEPVANPDDAACFQHPAKKAVVPCDACGRFLCALCDLEVEGQHLCPACLESGRRKGTVAALERSRTRWDQVTVALAALGLFTGCLSPVAAVANLVITLLKWGQPQSRVAAARACMVGATVVAWALALVLGGLAWWEWGGE